MEETITVDGSDVREFDDVLVEALAAGRSHAEAGGLVGRSAKTVQRRMADLRSGAVQGKPVEDVLARLREHYP